ncbi:MAG TPA: CHASE domain-containing protein [Burkholderiales bacterium]|nr:CHASE domain-containing protein [Burkholderiales bacterium]
MRVSHAAKTPGLAVFLLGVAITALTVAVLTWIAADRDRHVFIASADNAQDAVLDRVETSIALLRGAAGLFASHETPMTVASFRSYVDRLALRERYPGLLGIGFSRRIAAADVPAFEREMRAQGHTGFFVWPVDPREEIHTITFLEPLDQRNRVAIGYDMYTNPTRREAMARARDTGQVAASGIVELVQEIDDQKQPGFLIYLPVYEGGTIPQTVAERRARLLGFVYSPIRARDFLSSAFSHEAAPSVNFSVYHGTSAKPSSLIFVHAAGAAGMPRFTRTTTADVGGIPWTFVFRSRIALWEALALPLIAALTGIALSWLLAVLVARESRARGAAQRALERERSARSEAEHASVMKDQFLATLSHELRTPIAAIVGWASMLRKGQLTESQVREGIAVIDRNARTQARLIDDLLDMNGIISGKLRMEMQPVALARVLNDVLAAIAPSAEAKGVTLERAIDASHCTVRGDWARLQQVAGNLVSNAIKFTPRGGRVRVALERDAGRVRLVVADTGEGIEPAALGRIFDRFVQADGSTSRRHGGLGLGLAIVRQLVTLHGGLVQAASPGPGLGATFTVELPLFESPAALVARDIEREGAADRILAGLDILVVEDEPDARALVRLLLEQRGARVRCAESAADALHEVRTVCPDVLVSDIGMPGIDGYEMMRRVKALRSRTPKRIAAIALTAYAREEDRIEAMRAGFDLHLVKPVRAEELVAGIARLAQREASAA